MEKFDHPLSFIFFNSIVTFGVILLIIFLMGKANLGNPIQMAASAGSK